jgi:hypothetical protein
VWVRRPGSKSGCITPPVAKEPREPAHGGPTLLGIAVGGGMWPARAYAGANGRGRGRNCLARARTHLRTRSHRSPVCHKYPSSGGNPATNQHIDSPAPHSAAGNSNGQSHRHANRIALADRHGEPCTTHTHRHAANADATATNGHRATPAPVPVARSGRGHLSQLLPDPADGSDPGPEWRGCR